MLFKKQLKVSKAGKLDALSLAGKERTVTNNSLYFIEGAA